MLRPSRILLVDDDIDTVALLTRHLREAGFEVTTVFDGANALSEIDRADPPPDVCLVDRNVPGLSGVDLLWKLRRRKASQSVPCILMSSDNDPQHRSQALSLGATDYVVKPFEPREILLRLGRVLEQVRARKARTSAGAEDDATPLSPLARPDMEGALRNVSLSDLIQLFLLTSRTCEISLTRGPLTARVSVERGEVVDARIGSEPQLSADQAFLRVSAWRAGHFRCRFGPITGARRTRSSTAALLFQATARRSRSDSDRSSSDAGDDPGSEL